MNMVNNIEKLIEVLNDDEIYMFNIRLGDKYYPIEKIRFSKNEVGLSAHLNIRRYKDYKLRILDSGFYYNKLEIIGMYYKDSQKIISSNSFDDNSILSTDRLEDYQDIIVDYYSLLEQTLHKVKKKLFNKVDKVSKDDYTFTQTQLYSLVAAYLKVIDNISNYKVKQLKGNIETEPIIEIINDNIEEILKDEEMAIDEIVNELLNPNNEGYKDLLYNLNEPKCIGKIIKDYLNNDKQVINKVKQIILNK